LFLLHRAETSNSEANVINTKAKLHLNNHLSIIVKNLHVDTTENELKKFFIRYGRINQVSVPRKDQKCRYAFIEFCSAGSVKEALSGNGKTIRDRLIRIETIRQ
jgi:RNA recognition motif-containing protein